MNRSVQRRATRPLILTLLLVLAAALLPLAPARAADHRPPPLPPGVAELARELEARTSDTSDEPRSDAADDTAADPRSPAARSEALATRGQELLVQANRQTAEALEPAIAAFARAVDTLRAGSQDVRADHIGDTIEHLTRAIAALDDAHRKATPRVAVVIEDLRLEAAAVAGDLARGPVERARDHAGDDRRVQVAHRTFTQGLDKLAAGDASGAIVDFGEAFADVSTVLVFDVELFEQNLRDAFDGEAVGYTFAIAQAGTIVAEDGVGQARTAPDSAASQYANKQVQVASVSKTLTAILILRLMEETGVQPDDLIAPYLPGYWVLGDGMDQVTFRQLLTHTSGLKQLFNALPEGSGVGNDYQGLRTMLTYDLPSGDGPYPGLYTNLNFSLLRVLTAGLMGIDPVDYPEFESESLTASAFAINLDSVYSSIGVPTSCSPTDPVPTLMYQWPLDGVTPGTESTDKVLTCGAFGFFISAHQLAGVLANLRYTTNLLSTAQFDLMRDDKLGLQSWSGDHGTYYGHGGQWNPGMQSCVMMFSITIDVAITVNSLGGNYPAPCTVARAAFDDAWVTA